MHAISLAILALAASTPAAAPAPPGATACSGCHAAAGPPSPPPLEGRPAAEIVEAMRAYRTGQRPATVMDRIAKGFTEAETDAVAEWLSRAPRPRR